MPADRGRHRHGAVKQRGGPTDDVSETELSVVPSRSTTRAS